MEERWIGTNCYRCNCPLGKNDALEYNFGMMPMHQAERCVKLLLEKNEKLKKKAIWCGDDRVR